MANPILPSGYSSEQSIYDELAVTATNQSRAEGHYSVGTRGYLPDGRVFYYASFGTSALVSGNLVIASSSTRATTHTNMTLTDSGAAITAGLRNFVIQESDVDTDDIIANEYKDGYFWVNDVTGEGPYYKIERHDSFDASGTATTGRVYLFDPIKVALGATSQISLARNLYDRVIPSTTSAEEHVVGVAPIATTASTALATDVTTTVAATTTYFGWIQTWGPAAVLIGDSGAQGIPVRGGTAIGEVETRDYNATGTAVDNSMTIGQVITGRADSEYALVDLRIRP